MNFEILKDIVEKWFMTSGIKIALIISFVFIAKHFISTVTKKILHIHIQNNNDIEYEKKLQTLYAIIKSLIEFIIIALGVVLILQEIGIQVGPILATAGVLGIAVGFGSQRLVEDIISGFIILINDQIRVGDVVQIGDKSGYVEKIDLKMVVLRDLSGNVHFIRNGKIDVVTNMTKDFSYALFEIGVAYKENIEQVIKVIKGIGEDLCQNSSFSEDILEPIEILGLDKFDDSAIIIKARIKTLPIKQWAVSREFNLRLKSKFDKLNIEIPFPQMTLHMAK
jgi:small-conductance mechanosensitive channel